MTDDALLTGQEILAALSSMDGELPRNALRQTIARWDEIGPLLLTMLEEAAQVADPPEPAINILAYAIYVMAQLRETRAYRPLCALASRNETFEAILADAITADFHIILTRVYGGDQGPLRALIEDEAADEFTRDAAVRALALLTATGRINPYDTATYLRHLHATLLPRGESLVWVSWQQAIANLGLTDLTPLVEDVFRRGWIHHSFTSLKYFNEDLRKAQNARQPIDAFSPHDRDDGGMDDVVALMAAWPMFQPEPWPKPLPARAAARPVYSSHIPITNPNRHIGRNDPCPCGSGKKFKKCCLATAM
jgi:hypothetical protein